MASSSLNVPDASSFTIPDGFPTATNIGSLTKELMGQRVVFKGRVVAHFRSEFAVKDEEGNTVICHADSLEPGFVVEFLRGGRGSSYVMIEGIVIIPSHFDVVVREVQILVTKLYYPSCEVAAAAAAAANSEVDGSTGKALTTAEELGILVMPNQIIRQKADMVISIDSDVLLLPLVKKSRGCIVERRPLRCGVERRPWAAWVHQIHIEPSFLPHSRINNLMKKIFAYEETIFEERARLYPARRREGDHIISVQCIDEVVVQDQPDVVRTSLFSKGFNFMKTKIISKGLDVLEVLGSEKLTKSALNLTAQMTGCLIASYFANSNNWGSSDGQLPKSLLYSAAAANTVGFLGSCAGIALRDKEPRAASIIGGIGTVFAAATFMMVMGTFIPNN